MAVATGFLRFRKRGIRFESESSFELESWIEGRIELLNSDSYPISMQVIRQEKSEQDANRWIIAAQINNLPMSKVVSLQTYLVRTYGSLSSED